MKIETALISVSDKQGLVELGRSLAEMGVKILSTGGTGKALKEAGVPFTKVSEHTGFPEILNGRVKTLHPKIHGGILAMHDSKEHQTTLEEHGIAPIGLVVVNLYPFSQTVAKEGVTVEEAIENIDIGGPTMIRAAAKNHAHISVVVDPGDYACVVAEMKAGSGEVSKQTRWELARKAFHHTAAYDSAISGYFEKVSSDEEGLPPVINLSLKREATLRYGENPHQRAGLYRSQFHPPTGIVSALQKHGKQLSFNNYLDLQGAWGLIREFDETACAIIKHTNPCGAALGSTPKEAYLKALSCDPVSAFGSIIAFNREVDAETSEELSKLFVEAVIAPAYTGDAMEVLTKKKNIRIMEMPLTKAGHSGFDLKRISGGVLVQDRDEYFVTEKDLKVVTKRTPTKDEIADLLFGWIICKHVKSNAIVYVKGGKTVGIGAGQMSRVDSAKIAADKAQEPLSGAVMASDAFFPFRDGLDAAAERGIRAVIEPGGSVRDEEVIAAADEHGIAMVFTGIRHFRH
ncbi:MAG: bifunctional phosphoribosylaminoimidazolecarboxamide formyltransferase/IMP cyclohydrolase [Acidobacteriota bacterium]|nr:MAG: bifunctional phosphoribosylaminoimidazolecarboxamide formyltransferase/IMP cyclohydrolase [Acidobacteriota bacterium]